MFARMKKSGKYQYLQIVENQKIEGRVVQRVIATIGRMDKLQEKDRIVIGEIEEFFYVYKAIGVCNKTELVGPSP